MAGTGNGGFAADGRAREMNGTCEVSQAAKISQPAKISQAAKIS